MVRESSRTLVIRADADSQIGTGHVMRCVALGQAWQGAGGKVVFVTRCDTTAIIKLLHDENFEVHELDSEFDFQSKLLNFKEVAPWVVLDGYQYDLFVQQAIRRMGFKLLCVDDYNHLPAYETDILLNQNISANNLNYNCNNDCRKLLGTRFAMLRREFRESAVRKHVPKTISNILVSMGGSDPCNASLQVIEALAKLDNYDLHVKVVVGSANPHRASLEQAVQYSTAHVQLIEPVRSMPELMSWADFAVSAAGSTCWELAALGVPFTTVVLADNQEELALQLDKQASVFCAGRAGEGMPERLAEHLSSVLTDHSIVQRCADGLAGLVDCFGVDRILYRPAADVGLDLFAGRLTLRSATMDDAECLFEWANDPSARQNSFSPKPIEWNDHLSWLQCKLKADNAMLFMLKLDDVPCGHIRYDLQDTDTALLSFVVAPAFRGMGLGRRLVEMSRNEPLSAWNATAVKAVTFVENTVSARVFETAGFTKAPDEQADEHPCNVFLWSG